MENNSEHPHMQHEKYVRLTVFFTGLSKTISALQDSFLQTNLNLKCTINIS